MPVNPVVKNERFLGLFLIIAGFFWGMFLFALWGNLENGWFAGCAAISLVGFLVFVTADE